MSSSPKVPGVVWLLASVIFALGTSEFMIAGLLENIARDLEVSLSAAGLLVTGFALGMIVGAPLMTVLTLRLPVRVTLVGAAAVFAAAHVMGALAPSYGVLMASRVIAAVACGAFWAVASVHTSRVASPAVLGRSLATLVGGMTIANVVGVPGGAWLGNALGWRSAFWVLAGVTVLAGLLVALTVRPAPRRDQPPLRQLIGRELEAFKHRRIWLSLSVTALFQAAVFASFSYFSPLLTQVAGLPLDAVPAVLAAFGVGTFIGVSIGGRLADYNLFGNMIGSLAALAASLVILALTAGWAPGAIAAMVLVGISGFSIAGALNARVFQVAGAAPTLASAVNTSAFNMGNALGPALGAWALAAGAPVVTTVWLGAGLAVAACVLAVCVRATDARWAALEA